MAINKFFGPYQFLSNFWPSEVELEGAKYPTVEHAYQAAKTTVPEEREKIRLAASAGAARKLGRKVTIRPDWEAIKVSIMADLLDQKFSGELSLKLQATGSEELIEGSWWGDTYWGVCKGEGQNILGKLLMKIRENLEKV